MSVEKKLLFVVYVSAWSVYASSDQWRKNEMPPAGMLSGGLFS